MGDCYTVWVNRLVAQEAYHIQLFSIKRSGIVNFKRFIVCKGASFIKNKGVAFGHLTQSVFVFHKHAIVFQGS